MSRDASISFEWGDGDTTFALRWAELAKLQEARDCGPYVLLDRLLSGKWRIEDIREVIRWGLIGGGKRPEEASKLIRQYVEGFPPVENLIVAQRIMGAGCVGAPDEPPPGEADAPNPAETASTISQTAS
jgi:hypothetical protein